MKPFISALVISLVLIMNTALARDFSEGQVWSYKARQGEEASTILINKIENDPKLGAIFHISVMDVRVKNRRVAGGFTTSLPHFPVSKETLEISCIKLLRHAAQNPDYAEGYAEWKGAFDKGEASIFTIPVSEIVQIVESTVNQ